MDNDDTVTLVAESDDARAQRIGGWLAKQRLPDRCEDPPTLARIARIVTSPCGPESPDEWSNDPLNRDP